MSQDAETERRSHLTLLSFDERRADASLSELANRSPTLDEGLELIETFLAISDPELRALLLDISRLMRAQSVT